jgi:pimeloyl-ACP methyl ester carboxylesterase
MNAFYGDAPGLRVPEFIELFSNKGLKALHRHFLASPEQFSWLLGFQHDQMQAGLTESQNTRYADFLGPIIDNNFRERPSAGPAFAQMTYQLTDEVAANTARLIEFRRSDVPLLLIWGKADPYLHVTVAHYMRSQVRNAALHVMQGTGRRSTQPPRSLAEHSNLRVFPRKLRSILRKLPPLPISRSTHRANPLASQRPASSPGSSGYPG